MDEVKRCGICGKYKKEVAYDGEKKLWMCYKCIDYENKKYAILRKEVDIIAKKIAKELSEQLSLRMFDFIRRYND